MNLPEYLEKIYDEKEKEYNQVIVDSDQTNPYEKHEADEAFMRLREIKAYRKILHGKQAHNTWSSRYPTDGTIDPECVGCGWDIMGNPLSRHINDCPVLLALVEPHSDRSDFDTWS